MAFFKYYFKCLKLDLYSKKGYIIQKKTKTVKLDKEKGLGDEEIVT
jgi:hypothetical protein